MQKINLTINPCQENWDAMTPEEKGRHCAVCQKTVIDFTKMETREMAKTMQEAGTDFCGRYLVTPEVKQKGPNWKMLKVAAVFLLMQLALVQAFAKKMIQADVLKKPGNDAKKPKVKAAKPCTLKGYVKDQDTKEDIAYAIVKVVQNGKIIAQASTGDCGDFVIHLKEGEYTSDSFNLEVMYLGYKKLEMKGIPPDQKEYNFNLELTAEELVIDVKVIGYDEGHIFMGINVVNEYITATPWDFLMIQDGDHTYIPGSTIRKLPH